MKSGMLLLIFLTAGAMAVELSEEARQLVERQKDDVRRLEMIHVRELELLMERYQKSNEPENAKAVEGVIAAKKKAMAGTSDDAVLKPLIGTWRRNTDGKIWKFDTTEAGSFNGRQAFTMTYDAEKRRVVVKAEKWVNTLEFTEDENVMSGSWKEDGEKTFELTREK